MSEIQRNLASESRAPRASCCAGLCVCAPLFAQAAELARQPAKVATLCASSARRFSSRLAPLLQWSRRRATAEPVPATGAASLELCVSVTFATRTHKAAQTNDSSACGPWPLINEASHQSKATPTRARACNRQS